VLMLGKGLVIVAMSFVGCGGGRIDLISLSDVEGENLSRSS
jgi:hypothetical protein